MLLTLSTCLLWLSTCGLWTVRAKDISTPENVKNPHRDLAPVNVDFGINLYQRLGGSAPEKNIFISPVTVSTSLALLSLGAKESTRTQLLQGLGFNTVEITEAEIHQAFRDLLHVFRESNSSEEMIMGSSLFLDQRLRPLASFSTDSRRYYESEPVAADFQNHEAASRQINQHVSDKTQGKIEDMFSGSTTPDALILVSYTFFRGTWAHPFYPENTVEKDFHMSETSTVRVPMMRRSDPILYFRDLVVPCQVVQLNYVGNGTVFFILPDRGEMDTVINALSRDTIHRWATSLTERWVDLSIPKVSITDTYDLESVLEDMGIIEPFTEQANFSSIALDGPLKVSKVIHKTVFRLDETGAKSVVKRRAPLNSTSNQVVINFNRPFLIHVFDNHTWSSLLMGKVMNFGNLSHRNPGAV